MKNFIIIIVAILLIQGCATPYQSKGFIGGYDEIQIDTNVFKVSFRGNGYTSRERATNFTLLRSAELALENGFTYFAIVDEKNSTRTYTTPTTFNTVSTGYGSYTTYTSGGYKISKPSTENTIILYRAKPEEIFTYNAEFLYKSMKAKYNIE